MKPTTGYFNLLRKEARVLLCGIRQLSFYLAPCSRSTWSPALGLPGPLLSFYLVPCSRSTWSPALVLPGPLLSFYLVPCSRPTWSPALVLPGPLLSFYLVPCSLSVDKLLGCGDSDKVEPGSQPKLDSRLQGEPSDHKHVDQCRRHPRPIYNVVCFGMRRSFPALNQCFPTICCGV